MAAQKVRRGNFGTRQVRVIALAVVGTLLLAYGAYRVGKVFDVFSSRYEVVTLVPSVLGLREGAPVTLAGQRIGQVKEIVFIPVGDKIGENNLRLTLALARDVREQVRGDSRAYLRTQGLLGDKFVDISPGSPGEAVVLEGDTLVAGESLDLEQFLAQAATALDEANLIVGELHNITSGLANGEGTIGALLSDEALYGRMVAATGELQSTLHYINTADGTLGRLIRDPAMYVRMEAAIARVDQLGGALLDGDGSLARLLRSDTLYRALAGAAASADSAMVGVHGIVAQLDQGEGTLQKLMKDPQLYEAFLKAVIDLQALITDIRMSPDKYKPNIRVDVFEE
jgi:phospholipid/cholesterol/gamma-HCH transport system substrate-binding protein